MGEFDPHAQTVRLFAADGETPINIPIPEIDRFNEESVSVSINYGSQLGAALIMLPVVLIMTPSSKLRRPSTVLHIIALMVCVVRMALLSAFFPSPFNEFYNYWAGDYSTVSIHHFQVSVAANVFSLLLVVVVEAALINQAWTMVTLWPNTAKYALSFASIGISLLNIGWRIALTVVLSKAVFAAETARPMRWVVEWSIITNSVSICWFCALFNVKLVLHLATNRSVLPSYKSLTPMEVLVMTNGLLMIVPVIFTGLEWGHWANFEAASLTLTSVTLLLPLGTLSAQRLTQSYGLQYANSSGQRTMVLPGDSNGSREPLKAVSSFTDNSGSGATPHISILSRCEGGLPQRGPDLVDVELGEIDDYHAHGDQVRVYHGFEQQEERV